MLPQLSFPLMAPWKHSLSPLDRVLLERAFLTTRCLLPPTKMAAVAADDGIQ
jgi:hypothetical protein